MQKIFAEVGQSLQQVGGECPDGWIEMSEPRRQPHLICRLVEGRGEWVQPVEDVDKARDQSRAALNPLRDTFLNRLAGIAFFSEEPETVLECKNLRVALLDITKDEGFLNAKTYEEMELALITKYRSIASGASTTVRNVFRELEI